MVGFPVDPRDNLLTGDPLAVDVAGGGRDLLEPQLVLDWMAEHEWEQSHDDWHNIRRWDAGCKKSNAPADGCPAAQALLAKGLWRAPIQEHAPGDGYAFLVMHRHMILALKQAFPKHAGLFSGFAHIPRTKDDPDNPTPWRDLSWTSSQFAAIDILENIEQHLDKFPTEDELGLWMQSTFRWTPDNWNVNSGDTTAGIHPAFHFQWAMAGSPGDLGTQRVNNSNFIFYKFHGWMDDAWQRYRNAKGIRDDDPTYKQELFNQCKEMHELAVSNRTIPPSDGGPSPDAAPREGFLGAFVRPFLEKNCVGCHGPVAPEANMTLAGPGVSSEDVAAALVGVKATNGQYLRVAPGDPDKSWLYLKISGQAGNAACDAACNGERMPPGTPLTADQVTLVRQWIASGGPAR
jgi:hypothetical protein